MTQAIPSVYDARLTARRADLTTLGACWREFTRRRAPRLLITTVVTAAALRFVVATWSWRDAIVPVAVLAAQPFVEWVIHRYLLHLKPFTFRGRTVELISSTEHRRHHLKPSDLDRVLLSPLEVGIFAVQIGLVTALLAWPYATLTGGSFLPLWLTALGLCYLGLFRYEWSHFLIHTPYVPKSSWYRTIWRNHRLHHFKHEGYWMGVSSNFSDRVLGTNPDARAVPRSPTARTLGMNAD